MNHKMPPLSFGVPLPENLDCYITRILQLQDQVRQEILSHSDTHSPVTFAVSGVSHVELQEFLPKRRLVYTLKTWLDDKKSDHHCGVVTMETEDDFHKLAESCDNIHWLHRETNVFKWKESKGDISVIQKFLNTNVSVFENVKALLDLPHRVVLVSDEPGVGKSTLVRHLALVANETDPALCVVMVNLGRHKDNLPDIMEMQHVAEFLVEACEITGEERDLFRSKLESIENICLIFDGLDEVDTDKAILLFQCILATRLQKMWIMTQPNKKRKLEKELSSLAFTIQPFSNADQRNFLVKCWKRNVSGIQDSTIDNFVDKLIVLVRKYLRADKAFTAIPLQFKFLAVAFENSLKTYSETGVANLPQKFDVLHVYDESVNRKLAVCYENKDVITRKSGRVLNFVELKEEFQQKYAISALLTFLSAGEIKKWAGSESNINKIKQFVSKVEECSKGMPIITDFSNEAPVFVHRTFVEYFAALWLSKNHKRVTDFLKEKFFDPNFEIMTRFFDRILCQKFDLHFAVVNQDKNSVEYLLTDQKLDVNIRDEGGRSALFLAVMNYNSSQNDTNNGKQEIIRTLLEHGADPGIEDSILRWRPLRLADKIGVPPVVLGLLLQKRTDFSDMMVTKQNIHNEEFVQCLLRAVVRHGYILLLIFMMKCDIHVGHEVTLMYDGCKTKATLLHEAIRCGQLNLVSFLVEHKANIEARDSRFERTPLIWAAEAGQLLAVGMLLQRGASVESRDEHGRTALMMAAENGRLDIVKLLMQQNADVMICDKYCDSVLHCAVRSGNVELVTCVLQRNGVRTDSSNHVQETPLWLAAKTGQLLITEMLLQRGANLHTRDAVCGYTPLHVAACEGQLPVVQCLLHYGANLTSRDEFGRTPLEVAVWYEHSIVADLLRHTERRWIREGRMRI